MRTQWLSFIIFAIAGLQQLGAQTPAPESDHAALQKRLQMLEQLVIRLEQKVNEMQDELIKQRQPPTAAVPIRGRSDAIEKKPDLEQNVAEVKEKPVISFGRDSFSISSPDKLYRLRIGGHLQAEGKTAYENKAFYNASPHQLNNSFVLRRARPILEGSLGQYIDFRFVPDFGNGKVLLYDAYADVKIKPYAVLRAGKMKTPLGLEQLQGDADVTFIERSLATDLVPNRDVGFEIYGNAMGRLNYQAAILNGAPVGQSYDGDVNQGKDIVGRTFFTPFAPSGPKMLNGLGFGVAASSGRQEGAVLPTFNTTGGQVPFFSYGSGSGSTAVVPTAAGRRVNYSPQLYYYNGPFGFIAEYVESKQKISAVINNSTIVRNIGHDAWQVAGSFVLTGEKKSYRAVVPRKGIEGGKNGAGWGAWELAARYSALNVDPTVFAVKFADPAKSAQAARTWTVGLNWYFNYFVKLQLDYEQTHFQGGNAGDAIRPLFGNRPTEKVFEQRLQFAF